MVNSNEFKNLYLTTMNSSYIKNFIKDNNLTDVYNNYMNNYANDINKYILYIPLTRGIKAHVSNYFRIALNINSITFFGNLNEEYKNKLITSYLLIQLLYITIHFIFKLGKIGFLANKVISPEIKKVEVCYSDMGVDLILYIFGTEYMTFISKENSNIISNPQSWENSYTNFKVFEKIYLNNDNTLSGGENQEKNFDCGIKFNVIDKIEIDVNEEKKFILSTDGAIKCCY